MTLSEKETLLAAFDDAWSHKWESFRAVTKDLTESEALYQHPVFHDTKQEDGWPLPGSILWHLVHLEYWYRYYIETIDLIPESAPPTREVSSAITLSEAMKNLLQTRAKLRARIEQMTLETFSERVSSMNVGEFVRMIARHDTYHTAQIALARRLYRSSLVTAGTAHSPTP